MALLLLVVGHKIRSSEPLRVCRRLQLLRGWSHGEAAETEVFT